MAWDRLRSSYDRVAGEYEIRFLDELNAKPRDRELLDGFAAAVGDPVVDVGCGPGQIGHHVRDRGRRVVGVDVSRAMAKRSAQRLDAAVAADMRLLPLATDGIAGLLAFYTVIHLRRGELEPVLREFARVLRPGGRMLLSAHEGQGEIELEEFLGAPVPFAATLFELAELTAATREAGFDIVLAERRAPYPTESDSFRLYVEATLPDPD